MRIDNLGHYPANSVIDTDLVIVGGGPAGLTIALELSKSDIEIVIVESGLAHETVEHGALNRIESHGSPVGEQAIGFRKRLHGAVIKGFDHGVQPFGVRSRALGGSARYWGGKTALFDDFDFAVRDWVPGSGWPIARSDLAPYFERGSQALNLGPDVDDDSFWDRLDSRIPRPPIDRRILQSFFWQFARARGDRTRVFDFVEEFRACAPTNTRILLNATATHINTSSADAFESLDLSTVDGVRSTLVAKRCVLAAGGIENPRLLLVSNRRKGRGLGNDHDLVGRYLMDHPGTQIGYFRKEDLSTAGHLGFYSIRDRGEFAIYSRGLTLSDEVKSREKLLNAAVYVVPEIAEDDPVESIRRLIWGQSRNVAADLLAPIASPAVLAKSLGVRFLQDRRVPSWLQRRALGLLSRISPEFVARAFQAYGVPRKWGRMTLHAMTEQEPNPNSRITLSDECDALGVPRARAHWIISSAERRTILRLARALCEELPKLGLPAPELEDWIVDGRPEDAPLIDMAHMIGTTRMSADPRTGVVDTDCQVHGVRGLYVAGSSIFPTSGHANPTLMITSLAIRLADRLRVESARASV